MYEMRAFVYNKYILGDSSIPIITGICICSRTRTCSLEQGSVLFYGLEVYSIVQAIVEHEIFLLKRTVPCSIRTGWA